MPSSPIEIHELLRSLESHRGSFPARLTEEVIARKEETIPAFLQILENVADDPAPWLGERMIHVFAMYLLALFRETRAYPLLLRIFAYPGEVAFDLAGDIVTEDLYRILASVSGGDTTGILSLIENEEANEWVRGAAIRTMVALVAAGQRSREEIMSSFLRLFVRMKREPGQQWNSLAAACADIWPHEALYELNRAYKDDLIEPGYISWKNIEQAAALGQEGCLERQSREDPLITDVAGDMRGFGWFRKPEREKSYAQSVRAASTVRRSEPKIGRNDPCQCGSGKKFKKCCGANNSDVIQTVSRHW